MLIVELCPRLPNSLPLKFGGLVYDEVDALVLVDELSVVLATVDKLLGTIFA